MKRTKKFVEAEKVALEIGVYVDDDIYKNLEKNNYFWDSKNQNWFKGVEPNPPTNLIYVRVWADAEKVEADANNVIQSMQTSDYVLEDKTEIYSCRPPKQLEGRIYLTFSRSKS